MSVVDEAANFSGGVVSAARKRDSWARREANSTDDEQREALREAIFDLEQRFPDLEDVPVGGAEAFARERGHGSRSRSPVHEGRRRPVSPGAGEPSRPPSESRGKTLDKAQGGQPSDLPGLSPGARRKAGAGKGQPTPKVDRAIRQTGIPGAAGKGVSVTMTAIGATVGLGLLYLVLTSAEKGKTAGLAWVFAWVSGALHRFLSLNDLFPSNRGALQGWGVGPGGVAVRGPGGEIYSTGRAPADRGIRDETRGVPGATLDNPYGYDESPGSVIDRVAERLRRGEVQRLRRERRRARQRNER